MHSRKAEFDELLVTMQIDIQNVCKYRRLCIYIRLRDEKQKEMAKHLYTYRICMHIKDTGIRL